VTLRPLLLSFALPLVAGCVAVGRDYPAWVCTHGANEGGIAAESTRFLRTDGSPVSASHIWSWTVIGPELRVGLTGRFQEHPGAPDRVVIVVDIPERARRRYGAAVLGDEGVPFRPDDWRFRGNVPAGGFTLVPPLETMEVLDAAGRRLEILLLDHAGNVAARVLIDPGLFARGRAALDAAMLRSEAMTRNFALECNHQPRGGPVFIA
jgi:hypothetical protein